jgi:DNA-binding protein Fis
VFVAIGLLSTIEGTFNDIWGVPRGRNWFARVIYYWAAITLGPLVIILMMGLAIGSEFQTVKEFIERARAKPGDLTYASAGPGSIGQLVGEWIKFEAGIKMLTEYHWPGNVRELENVMERAVVLSNATEIGMDLLPDHIANRQELIPLMDHTNDASLFDILEECERRILVRMLEKCNWNQTEAAERFRVPLSTLNQKIKRLNIEIKKKVRE